MSEVLVINELRQAEAHDRRALENRLKPLLAAPPELIPVNRKGLHPFDALNRLSVVAFSNERMAITLPSDDRRWYVLWSDAKPLTIREGDEIWDWLKTGGGRDAGAGWLRARDVSAFAPGGAPPMTEAKAIMLAAGLSAVESALGPSAAYTRCFTRCARQAGSILGGSKRRTMGTRFTFTRRRTCSIRSEAINPKSGAC
jgi:hypothetical protein